MKAQVTTVHLLLLFYFTAANDIISEGFFMNPHRWNHRQYKNHDITMCEQKSLANAPFEYLKTPNFDVMLLTEDNSNPTWKKYSDLFQPKDLHNPQQIEVNYGCNTATIIDRFQRPSIRLDRSEVESVLDLLGDKKHIIVLHPRNCKPHSAISGIKQSSLDEFENEFLPKFLQQLHKRPTEQHIGSEMVDPVVDRILAILDKDEQKMLEDLTKTFEGYPSQRSHENSMYSSGYTTARRRPNTSIQYEPIKNRIPKRSELKTHPRNMLFTDQCNEGYVFLVQNQKNPMDSGSLNDLLMRVLKVVTESS